VSLILVCRDDNDLCEVLDQTGVEYQHLTRPDEALVGAAPGDGVLILADGYPDATTQLDAAFYASAAAKGLRLYVEYPSFVPGLAVGAGYEIAREVAWERAVVASDVFAPAVNQMRILMMHGCRFLELPAESSHLVLAHVAGFDVALYGLPERTSPVLFEHPRGDILVAATKLSQFVTGRYAPVDAWSVVWRWILRWVCPDIAIPELMVTPVVRPAYAADACLSDDAGLDAAQRGVSWFRNAKLFIDAAWKDEAQHRLETYPDGVGRGPDAAWPVGDGSCGLIEGASSRIHWDGTQDWRYHVRADCVGETSMAMASAWALFGDAAARDIAANLNDFIYAHSVYTQGPRANPESSSYGLVSWTTLPPADGVYYGDDNARSMLGTMAASAFLDIDRWDVPLLRCLLANLRTTGPQGFRGGRLEEADLQEKGWRHYWETERTHYAPHYESWMWACYLWAHRHTRFGPFLDRASTGIRMTMAAYPDEWRWTNGIQQERARMLLPLAWLVRVDDTPTHRGWLRRIAEELLGRQDACGAIGEEVGSPGLGAYGPPRTNAEYGTTEAPLIQQNGDPLSDLLYTTNFAFVGLHEAAAATDDPFYAEAADRLADYLCRIQVRSEVHPELDGGWFRSFDFRRWEYWASNADVGWGAWSIESGWTQAWITSVLALRQMQTSLWTLTAGSRIGEQLEALVPVMRLTRF